MLVGLGQESRLLDGARFEKNAITHVAGGTVALSGTPIVSVYAMQEVEDTDDKGQYLTNPIALKKVSFQEVAYASSNANA